MIGLFRAGIRLASIRSSGGAPGRHDVAVGNLIPTARLLLRLLDPEQAHALLDGRPDPSHPWASGYPTPGTLEAARGYLFGLQAGVDPGDFGMYQVVRLEDGLAVGDIGFHGPPAEDRSVTVGYGMAEAVRGRGYATEALVALIAWSVASGRVTTIRADTRLDNLASQRVLEKAGMRLVGEDASLRYYRYP